MLNPIEAYHHAGKKAAEAMTWQAWTADGVQVTLTAACTSEMFNRADAIGAIRLQDGNGSICRKIGGEWFWL